METLIVAGFLGYQASQALKYLKIQKCIKQNPEKFIQDKIIQAYTNNISRIVEEVLINTIIKIVTNIHDSHEVTDNDGFNDFIEDIKKLMHTAYHKQCNSTELVLIDSINNRELSEQNLLSELLNQQSALRTIYDNACSEGLLDRDPQKTYQNVLVERTANDCITRFNFLLDLDLIKNILNTQEYKIIPCEPVIVPNTHCTNLKIKVRLINPIQDYFSSLQPVVGKAIGFFTNSTIKSPATATEDLKDSCTDEIENEYTALTDSLKDNNELRVFSKSIEESISVASNKNLKQIVVEALNNTNISTLRLMKTPELHAITI